MILNPFIILSLMFPAEPMHREAFTFEHDGFTCVCWPTDEPDETHPPAPLDADEPEHWHPAPYGDELAFEAAESVDGAVVADDLHSKRSTSLTGMRHSFSPSLKPRKSPLVSN